MSGNGRKPISRAHREDSSGAAGDEVRGEGVGDADGAEEVRGDRRLGRSDMRGAFDVLASNPLALAFSPRLRPGENRLRSLILDPEEREFHADWDAATAEFVGSFRKSTGEDTSTLNQAAPLRPLPYSVTDLDHFRVRRRDRAGGVIHEYRLVA
jgi:hypothetical protein